MKKLYLLASILDENASMSAVKTEENSVLFPIRYYKDELRWDEKRVLYTRVSCLIMPAACDHMSVCGVLCPVYLIPCVLTPCNVVRCDAMPCSL